jgi:AcrR family transcriptional regulator
LRSTQVCVTRKFDTLKYVTIADNRAPDSAARVSMAHSASRAAEPDGLRERKKAATRRALGIAAMRLAVERGIENVLVEDIAAEVGVSARTFNNYFASKYEAICALAVERARFTGAALRSRPPSEPLMEAITNAMIEPYTGGEFAPDKEWIAGVRLVVCSPALQGEYLRAQYAAQQALAEAIADRMGTDVSTEMFPRVMAGAVTAAMQVALERWLLADPPTALIPLIRLALSQLRCPLPASATPVANSLAIAACPADPDQVPRPPASLQTPSPRTPSPRTPSEGPC